MISTPGLVLRDKDMFQREAEQMNQGFAALGARITAVKALSDQLQTGAAPLVAIPALFVEELAAELSAFTLGTNTER